MARLVAACALGVVIGTAVGAALGIHGQDGGDDSTAPSPATIATAEKAGVDPLALLGAAHTTGLEPEQYLIAVGELATPGPPASARPPVTAGSGAAVAGGGVTASTSGRGTTSRVACLESKESQGRNIANRQGSGAVGVLQYMPTTFAAHAREMGHPEYSPWVPWQARAVAEHDLALGRRSQWAVSGC